MRAVTLLCLFGFAAVVVARPESPFDNINIDEVFDNRRLFISYIKCILEIGKCTRAGKDLKSSLKDVLNDDCESCSEDERKSINKVMDYLVKSEPEYWDQLKTKYDPEGKHLVKYETISKSE